MKKLISLALVLAMVLAMVLAFGACSSQKEVPTDPSGDPAEITDPAPETIGGELTAMSDEIFAKAPVEFSLMTNPVDLNDTSETGVQMLKYNTGLESADSVVEATVTEAMIGSIPFSLVLVRVAQGQDAKAVGQQMYDGIDTRKWICVEADDLMVVGKSDVVMLVMIGSSYAEEGLTAQYFVDGFTAVCGDVDFTFGN